ncbi:MAG: hypothetical protein NVS3B6_01630 [Pseudarthrobacter sp.]
MALGKEYRQGQPGGIGFSIDHGVDRVKDTADGGVEFRGVHGGRPVAVKVPHLPGGRGKIPAGRGYLVQGGAAVGVHLQPFSPGIARDGTAGLLRPSLGVRICSYQPTNTTAGADREFLEFSPYPTALGWKNVQFTDSRRIPRRRG